jgi:YD repeat-containing protein
MRKNPLPCLLLFSVLGAVNSNAQQTTENQTPLDVNIKTPNVASMERYGNIPVGYFTGVPNISVPLYSISIGGHTMPISASYHASGIQVDDVSSDIGLSWHLNANFSISRVMRGKPDEQGYVGHNDAGKIVKSSATISTFETQDSFRAAITNIIDVEPDEFNFNIAEYSGKFIMAPDKIIVMPDQDLRIEANTISGKYYFIVTDPHGIKYYFNDASLSHYEGCGDFAGTWDYNSSWYVSKIMYPDMQDSLVFNYVDEYMELSSFSQSVNYDYGLTPQAPKPHSCTSYNMVFEKKISNIIFPDGRVDFHYAIPKLEISTANSSPKAIDFINISDGQGNLFQKINFSYSYYNSASTNNLEKKLKLDSLFFTSPSGEVSNKYIFGYNGFNIPGYMSKSKDDWGYYNGAVNSSLIPGGRYKLYDASNIPFYIPGGNRDVNSTYNSIGVLNKIIYPTGGYTQFDYETNSVGRICDGTMINDTVFTQVTKTAHAICTGNTSPFQQTTYVDFTPPTNQTTEIIITTNQFNCTGDTRSFSLTDLSTQQTIASGIISANNVHLIANHNYRLQAIADCRAAEANMLTCQEQITAKITYTVPSSIINKNRLAGGLRVKKMTNFDPYTGLSNVKKYTYSFPEENDRSSGVPMFTPIYNYMYRYLMYTGGDPSSGSSGAYLYDYITSYCFTSAANNTSQSDLTCVAYQYVQETNGDQGEGGSIRYTFTLPYKNCEFEFPFAPQSSRYYMNGRLSSQQVFNSANALVQKTDNYYSYVDNASIQEWKVSLTQARAQNGPGIPLAAYYYQYNDHYIGRLYNYYSQKERLVSTVVTNYFESPSSLSVSTTNSYTTNSSYYPYKSTTTKSDGTTEENTIWRSADFSVTPATGLSGASYALRYMQDNHMNAYPVESYSQINGLVTGASITEYLVNDLGATGKKILPASLYKLESQTSFNNYTPMQHVFSSSYGTLPKDSRMTLQSSCQSYTPNGGPRRVTTPGDKSSIFLYGYKGRNPIVSISNIEESSLNTYLSSNPSILSVFSDPANDPSLRNAIRQVRNAFPNSMVTGYTYKPLIGITSETDANNKVTYYEYDSFGRLLNLKDQNGNIAKQNVYQIQGPQ